MTQVQDETLDVSVQVDKLEVILDVAENLARHGGYFCFQLSDIANKAGLSKAEVEAHFESEKHLSSVLVRRYANNFLNALGSPKRADALDDLINAWGTAARKDGQMCLCTLYGAEISALPPVVANETRKFFVSLSDWIAEALDCAHSDTHSEAILASLCGALVTVRSFDRPESFNKIAWLLVKPVIASCCK